MPVTNLKDRIAALEQQRNAAGAQRSASSSPQIGGAGSGSANGSPSVGALRDKIAKFEKKGGVPVPRGTFGLGAPPPPEARVTRNGELYGNRPGIPQPLRAISAQHTGGSMSGMSSRSGSSMGFYGNDKDDWRQSVSSVITDLDDRPDYTPLTSPTFGPGPTSPDSPGSTTAGYTPEGSPVLPSPPAGIRVESNGPRPVVSRSTSFAAAVEMAKKVAENGGSGGLEKVLQDGASPTPFIVNTAAIKQSLARSTSRDRAENIHAPTASTDAKAAVVDDVLTSEPTNVTSPSQLPYLSLQSPGSPPVASSVPSTGEGATPTAASFGSQALETPVKSDSQESSTKPLEKPEASSTVPTVQVSAESAAVVSPSPSLESLSSPSPPEESKKGSSRNNKDLTLNVDALKAQPKPTIEKHETTPTDDTTPTTSTYLTSTLSPPPTALSTASSVGTPDSLISPRPYSMVEFSLAERVTPATSRGNVMFIAPSTATLPRKSDMAFYPPTPTKDELKAPTEEPQKEESGESNLAFTTVVHGKVREAEVTLPSATTTTTTTTTRARSGSAPQTPKKKKHMTLLPLNSPAQPELFSLLQNAVMLESTLEHGELPEEANLRIERERREMLRKQEAETLAAALAADKAKAKEAEDKLLAFREQEKQKEMEEAELSKKAKLRHTFLIPLSKAKAVHGATAEEEAKQSKELPELPDLLPSPDAGVDPASAYPPLHSALQSAVPPPATPVVVPPPPLQSAPQSQSTFYNHPPPPPIPRDPPAPAHDSNDRLRPKSAGVTKSRFSLRKFGSVKSVIGLGGVNSSRRSDMSDSMSISDAASMSSIGGDSSMLGHGDMDEFGGMPRASQHHEREGTWPNANLSPTKKGGMSRASTIGKMFSRSRNKSNGSNISNMSDSSRAASTYILPPLPDSLGVIPPSPEGEQPRDRQPRRSISMKSLKGALKARASMDKDRAAAPPVPQIRTETIPTNTYNSRESSSMASTTSGSASPTSTLGSPGPLRSPDYIGFGSMNIPSDRPTSWMSVSSLESTLPSPLFEKDIFDAFPAVPSSAAMTPAASSIHRFGGPGGMGSLDQGLQSAALMTPSFDSAFLGSAIHLAGSHKLTLSTPTTATGSSFIQQAPPTPQISAAPSGLSGQGRPKSRTSSMHRS